MASIQILLRPISETNSHVDIEISDTNCNGKFINILPYTVRITKPEPIAGFEDLLVRHVEDYALKEPFEAKLAEKLEKAIVDYGRDLYDQLRLGELMGELDKNTVAGVELCVLEAPGSVISGIHWELLELFPIAEMHQGIDIRVSRVTTVTEDCGSEWLSEALETLNILVVVARPYGKTDIPYRNVLLPLTNISNGLSNNALCIDIVRLGTWEAVQKALSVKPAGYYHIVHFDVHGDVEERRAFLSFEPSSFTDTEIEAEDVAKTLSEHGVKAVILNACRSAQKPSLAGSSIAMALLQHGLNFVIGMPYKIHQDGAKYFLQGLYTALLVDKVAISEAVALGREEMQSQPARGGRFGIKVDVQDWHNPVLYLRAPAVGRFRASSQFQKVENAPQNDNWCDGFYGRDYDISCIEKALCSGTVARIQGFRGTGKSTLIKHLQEWWIRSNFAKAIFLVDFSETDGFTTESPKISPGEVFAAIDEIIMQRQRNRIEEQKVYKVGPRPRNGPRRNSIAAESAVSQKACTSRLKTAFLKERYIILFNAFDNISSVPFTGDFNFYPWAEEMQNWLKNLDWMKWKSKILFSSTLDEKWLNRIPVIRSTSRGEKLQHVPAEIIHIEGLNPGAATQFAEQIIDLTSYLEDPVSRLYLERIMQYYQYQPLALKIVLPHLKACGLTPKQYFEDTLCSQIQPPLEDTGEQKRLLMDIMLASMSASGAIPVPIIAGTTDYCPQPYLMDLLKGDGPFEAVEDPQRAFDDEIETYQDFGVVRYVEPTSNVSNGSDAGYLIVHPLFTAYTRGIVSQMRAQGRLEPVDLEFAYLVYYLAQRCEDWEAIDSDFHTLAFEIENNWFNILAALRYCVIRPYNWDSNSERLFDFLMNRTVIYAVDYKQDSWDILAEIASKGIARIMNEFSTCGSITEPWWKDIYISDDDETDPDDEDEIHKVFPVWLLERVIKLYGFLQFYCYRKFDPEGWYYNAAIIGLLDQKQSQGYIHGEGEIFLEQQALISAAEIAQQSSTHYCEGLAYLAKVDLENVTGPMKEHLEIRERDITAELMGYVMDVESYKGDMDEYSPDAKPSIGPFGEERIQSRPMRALKTRQQYAKALRTGDGEDIKAAKDALYRELDLLKDPSDPYSIVLHRYMCDLFKAEEDWNGAVKQLRIILDFIDLNPGAFQCIVNENGRNSYLMDLHQEMAECYEKLGDQEKASVHLQIYNDILEEREKEWSPEDAEQEAAMNLLEAMKIAFQQADDGSGPAPQDWMRQIFERVPMEKD
ncbi:hypothetical protein TWF730_008104 [Orbilia blumenaviensis]|uniref:CHAT domain-containing protein n=1 Tax=Orbilia blumenaviensis TaxID=1796055 RepID=A0AAV9V9U0_9PEZI